MSASVLNMRISKEIESLIPYQPGKPISETQREFGLDKVIKLASNENPLGVSPKVVRALHSALDDLHRYPDPSCYELRQTLAKVWHVSRDKMVIGNGSNELIDLLIRIFCEPGQAILTIESAFVAYEVCAQAARVRTVHAPLNRDYSGNLDLMADILRLKRDQQKIRLVFLPNPNNPTGSLIPTNKLLPFLEEFSNQDDLLVVLDEAYTEYIDQLHQIHGIDLQKQFPRLIVLRTLSKAYGLAGLRVGVLCGPSEVVDLLNRVRNPFNVNSLAQVAAVAAVLDSDFVRESVRVNKAGRDFLQERLKSWGLKFVPSQANFVFFDLDRDATEVFRELLKMGVILRPVKNYGFPTHLRMSIGLPQENQFALECLEKVLKL